ncbi:MAG: SMI1/KNR4 family protein [Myxococcota bacterium]
MKRFYGVAVPRSATKACRENLTTQDETDLVTAHLKPNYAYFGAIDKTLAGFCILDDEGDDYHLLDLREPKGKVWFQDHETRETWVRFATVEDWVEFEEELAKARRTDDDVDDLYAQYRPKKSKAKPATQPTSAELLARYQWLVQFFAQPLKGVKRAPRDYAESAAEIYYGYWKSHRRANTAFKKETKLLANDPHLAIYWLLHFTLVGDDARRAEVVGAVKSTKTPLVKAFVDTFGELGLRGTLKVLKDFTARRSFFAYILAFQEKTVRLADVLRAFQIDPKDEGLRKALQVARSASELGESGWAVVESELAGLRGVGVTYLQARVDQFRETKSSRAGAFLKAFLKGGEPLVFGPAIHDLLPSLETDPKAKADLSAAGATLMAFDAYSAAHCAIALAGETKPKKRKELEGMLRSIEEIGTIVAGLVADDTKVKHAAKRARKKLAAAQQVLLAMRVLSRADAFEGDSLTWAIDVMLGAAHPEREALLIRGVTTVGEAGVRAIKKRLRGATKNDAIDLLTRVIEVDEGEGDFLSGYHLGQVKEAAANALSPHAHDKAVFARLIAVLDGEGREEGKEAILDELWDRRSKHHMLKTMTASQAQTAVSKMIALIKKGNHVAGHSLFYFDHPGAEATLIAALEEGGHEEVVANCYAALRYIGKPSSYTAILSMLYTEKTEFWRLCDAVEEIFSAKIHKQALAMLKKKPSARAANNYAASMVEFVKKPEPLIDLADLVLGWQLEKKDERGWLKWIFLTATKAAIDTKKNDKARAFWAAAEAISESPKSLYWDIDRDSPWHSPFEDKALRKKLDGLLSGKADRQKQQAKAGAAQAKRAGKPKKASNKLLEELAGGAVATRIFVDVETHEVLFRDASGEAHYYDGFEVTEPPFALDGHCLRNAGTFLTKGNPAKLDERVVFWDSSARRMREWIRCGARVVSWGDANNTHFYSERQSPWSAWCVGLAFGNATAAAEFMARVRANPEKGFAENDPWYVTGKGAILRTYHTGTKSTMTGILEAEWIHEKKSFPTPAEAIEAFEAQELKWFKAGRFISCIEWMDRHRKPTERALIDYFHTRRRSDGKSVVWHMDAFREMQKELKAHGVLGDDVAVQIGKAAPAKDIAALEKALKSKLPETLKELWGEIGSVRWRVGERGLRLLSPKEVLARRDAMRERSAIWIEKMSPGEKKLLGARFEALHVLVEDQDDKPVTVWTDKSTKDGRVFTHLNPGKPTKDLWWEKSLAWILCTQLTRDFVEALAEERPELRMICFGMRPNPDAVKKRLELKSGSSAKFWEAICDDVNKMVATRYGKVGSNGSVSIKQFPDAAAAKAAFDDGIAKKKKKGYKAKRA